jgi:cell division septal protein FtsQ
MSEKTFLRPGVARAPRPRRISALLWVVFLAAAGAAAVRYLGGPALSISRFEIGGCRRARTRDLLAVLSPYRGRNLATLNLAPISAGLEKVAWIDRVTVSKEFPDALKITIAEKTPVALRREGGALFWLDADGRVVAPYDARLEPADAPVVTAPDERLADATGLLRSLQKEIPEYASSLSEIWALPSRGFGMMDSIFRVPIEVMPADAPEKIRALLSLRAEIESRGLAPRAIDLRFDRRIVLSGAWEGDKRI